MVDGRLSRQGRACVPSWHTVELAYSRIFELLSEPILNFWNLVISATLSCHHRTIGRETRPTSCQLPIWRSVLVKPKANIPFSSLLKAQ